MLLSAGLDTRKQISMNTVWIPKKYSKKTYIQHEFT